MTTPINSSKFIDEKERDRDDRVHVTAVCLGYSPASRLAKARGVRSSALPSPLPSVNLLIGRLKDAVRLAVLCLVMLSPGVLPAQIAPMQDNSSFAIEHVVLHTGAVFSGIVTRKPDGVSIRQPNGIVVHLPSNDIDFVADSLEYAGERLANRIVNDRVESHLDHANWCLRNKAPRAASREIEWLALNGYSASGVLDLQERHRNLVNTGDQHGTVRSAVPAGAAAESGNSALQRHLELEQRLQAAVDSLSKEARRDFTSQVHNRILSGCAAAQCHTNPESPLRLFRVSGAGGLGSTGIQRNLAAILDYVDRTHPERSPLLAYLTTAHGDQLEPAFDKDTSEWRAIRDWVLAAGIPEAIDPSTGTDVRVTSFEGSALMSDGSLVPRPVDLGDAPNAGVSTIDPYDPAVFNKQYASRDNRNASAEVQNLASPWMPQPLEAAGLEKAMPLQSAERLVQPAPSKGSATTDDSASKSPHEGNRIVRPLPPVAAESSATEAGASGGEPKRVRDLPPVNPKGGG